MKDLVKIFFAIAFFSLSMLIAYGRGWAKGDKDGYARAFREFEPIAVVHSTSGTAKGPHEVCAFLPEGTLCGDLLSIGGSK